MLTAKDMTLGQLRLEYASLCAHHGCSEIMGLGYASRVPESILRAFLMAYEVAAEIGNWTAAEDALMSIAEYPGVRK